MFSLKLKTKHNDGMFKKIIIYKTNKCADLITMYNHAQLILLILFFESINQKTNLCAFVLSLILKFFLHLWKIKS